MERRWATAALLAAMAGAAGAGGLAPAGGVATGLMIRTDDGSDGPTPLEWVRHVGPRVGHDVVAVVDGRTLRTIEWRHDVEVRVRTESGAPLTPAEQAAVTRLALVCRRGDPTGPVQRTEPNGTFVVDYACAWLQGTQ